MISSGRPLYFGTRSRTRRPDAVQEALLIAAGSMLSLQAMVIHVPITFSPGHPEINQDTGILSVIKERALLEAGSPGAEPIEPLESLGPDLITLAGRTGFSGFRNTGLDVVLGDRRIQRILLAGSPTVACVDSPANRLRTWVRSRDSQ